MSYYTSSSYSLSHSCSSSFSSYSYYSYQPFSYSCPGSGPPADPLWGTRSQGEGGEAEAGGAGEEGCPACTAHRRSRVGHGISLSSESHKFWRVQSKSDNHDHYDHNNYDQHRHGDDDHRHDHPSTRAQAAGWSVGTAGGRQPHPLQLLARITTTGEDDPDPWKQVKLKFDICEIRISTTFQWSKGYQKIGSQH